MGNEATEEYYNDLGVKSCVIENKEDGVDLDKIYARLDDDGNIIKYSLKDRLYVWYLSKLNDISNSIYNYVQLKILENNTTNVKRMKELAGIKR